MKHKKQSYHNYKKNQLFFVADNAMQKIYSDYMNIDKVIKKKIILDLAYNISKIFKFNDKCEKKLISSLCVKKNSKT